jgi:hypothetical protein
MRGKLPRSFKLLSSDPAYHSAHLYDASLAIIATVGLRANSLSEEIVVGSILSQFGDGSIPFVADNIDPTGSNVYIQNNTTAITAYALAYYLELRPTVTNSCTIVQTIRTILAYLESQRDFVKYNGLIKVGTDSEGEGFDSVFTEDNILAYFAFKQAAFVLGEGYYLNTANALKTSILSTLKASNGRFYNGLSSSAAPFPNFDSIGTVTEDIQVNSYGALFHAEIGDMSSASTLLTNCENFRVIDPDNGAIGYKVTNTGTDQVWFEQSYAVALGYYKVGNRIKYNQIISDLNRYVDNSDGGVIGELIKDITLDNSFIDKKAIGPTAWAIIANNLKSSAFSTRSNVNSITGCPVPHFNDQKTGDFTKTGCAVGTTPSTETYVVDAGRYISYISKSDANDKALADVAANGQAYANRNGICAGTVGNDEVTVNFNKECPLGQVGSLEPYTVLEDTFFAATQEEADDLALAYAMAHGQEVANTNGVCSPATTIMLDVETESIPIGGNLNHLRATIQANIPVTDNLYITFVAEDQLGVQYFVPGGYIYVGQTFSAPITLGYFSDDLTMTVFIINVAPNPDTTGTEYAF